MPNIENLKPIRELSKEEAKKRGSAGGKASVQARREKKYFKEEIERQLGASLEDVIKALLKKAKQGDVQASQFLRDTIGEKPTDKVENTNVDISYEEYLKKVEDEDAY
jgi:erythromycin esterase-like protein